MTEKVMETSFIEGYIMFHALFDLFYDIIRV